MQCSIQTSYMRHLRFKRFRLKRTCLVACNTTWPCKLWTYVQIKYGGEWPIFSRINTLIQVVRSIVICFRWRTSSYECSHDLVKASRNIKSPNDNAIKALVCGRFVSWIIHIWSKNWELWYSQASLSTTAQWWPLLNEYHMKSLCVVSIIYCMKISK